MYTLTKTSTPEWHLLKRKILQEDEKTKASVLKYYATDGSTEDE